MPLLPGTRIGTYEVTAVLGAGGMGEVYRAKDSKLKREVALKVLPANVASDRERLARFQREAELLASLNHPHITQIHGLEESGTTIALVMELVEGQDLSQRIARGGIGIHETLTIAKQIASALEAAHEQGIIHRDLKPGNIKVRPDGTVKILDFGLAKSLAPAVSGMSTVTAISTLDIVVGTPAYMSPEQARGEATSHETDIWAFGVVLYEMLTGVSPFARPNTTETLAQVLTASPDESRLPQATPSSIRRLVRHCLERDPKRRWRNMGDARIVIEEALTDSAETLAGAPVIRASRVSRRKALLYGSAASLALVGSGFGGAVWLDRRGRVPQAASFRRLTFRRGLIRSARFAPDGQTILYGALWEGEPCRIHTVRVDGPESRPLEDLPNANLLAISRSGEVALALGSHELGTVSYGTLARVPMAGGAPRQIVEDVKFADWSPDGTDLAIIRRVDGRDQLQFPIGKTLFAPTTGQGTGLGFPRISPDGKRVAFAHYRSPASLTGRVAVVDQSGTVTPMSGEYVNVHGLVWRGNEILFTAADDRPLFRALLAVTTGGSPRTIMRMPTNVTVWDCAPDGRLLTAQTDDFSVLFARLGGDGNERDFSWLDASRIEDLSAGGRLLLFSEVGQGGGAQSAAYLRATDGSAAVRLGEGRALALSPDTRWAICASANFPSPYLELVPTGAGEPRRIQDKGLEYNLARWLPDGKRVIVSASEPGKQSRLFLHDLSADRPRPLTPEGVAYWVVSPEGSAVAVRGPSSTILIYDLAGSQPREVPGLTGTEVPVAWITEGLLVVKVGDPTSPLGQIYRIDSATGRQEPWKSILPRDPAGIMNLVGVRVTPDGKSMAYSWHRALSSLYVADGLV